MDITGFIKGADRSQTSSFPERLEDRVAEDHSGYLIDLFVGDLDLVKVGFRRPLAVYDTDFSDSFKADFASTILNLAIADVQHGIGDYSKELGIKEGSAPHAFLHGLTGFAAARRQNTPVEDTQT